MEVGLGKLKRQSPDRFSLLHLRLDVVGANNWPALMDPGSTSSSTLVKRRLFRAYEWWLLIAFAVHVDRSCYIPSSQHERVFGVKIKKI